MGNKVGNFAKDSPLAGIRAHFDKKSINIVCVKITRFDTRNLLIDLVALFQWDWHVVRLCEELIVAESSWAGIHPIDLFRNRVVGYGNGTAPNPIQLRITVIIESRQKIDEGSNNRCVVNS